MDPPISFAMDTPIGAINAPVAVLDIKFVSTIHINNMAASIVKGFVPTNPKTNCAIIGPAPVFSNAIQGIKCLQIIILWTYLLHLTLLYLL